MAAITAEQKAEFVEAFQELATETGVVGVPRLVALFSRRNGDVGLSQGTLTEIAREALQTKASKQILRFPRESTSGGAVSAGHKDHVWQADTASMFTFGGWLFFDCGGRLHKENPGRGDREHHGGRGPARVPELAEV